MLKASVLDYVLSPPGVSAHEALTEAVRSAVLVEQLGYERLWFSEHHNSAGLACSAPELIIARVAAETSRLRVGAGGIMLPNHAPLKVAELFHTLEALYPGRIDLGLGRAPGTDGATAMALRGSRRAVVQVDFDSLAEELFGFLDNSFPLGHPLADIVASPAVPAPPQVWMLGSSDYGATYAAAHGLPFSFAQQINPDAAVAMLRRYRDTFRPSERAATPYSSFSVVAFASDDDEESEDFAAYWALTMTKLRSNVRTPTSLDEARAFRTGERYASIRAAMADRLFTGTPDEVGARVRAVAEQARADEVVLAVPMPDPLLRHKALRLLATEFALPAGG
ncbi:LLM class flavin-dependent oxidoreductase [Nocardiopsis ansamitocini]|uniref:N5,N10-methylene tetrahydromethanopterin reductase n=1 Tax=Nocardiopsis ansamitocini TaxID=1670832 RepID=A0A9W6P6D5_9ACTN|nr:LLM class flavin-dependent oxidoreductase [Nocardiopsis ansamitocini]GLU47907.1 N5,N10-methylene tetrahydromethanopterin reductase [Nocardiopsis ansamitocini]